MTKIKDINAEGNECRFCDNRIDAEYWICEDCWEILVEMGDDFVLEEEDMVEGMPSWA